MWNVLIAEDDLDVNQNISRGLVDLAHCTCVDNGDDAVETFQKALRSDTPFDFVLLDVQMPISDGFEALSAIRQEEKKSEHTDKAETIIIMLTSYEDSLLDKINMGWDDFISKPVNIPTLIEHMKKLIEH